MEIELVERLKSARAESVSQLFDAADYANGESDVIQSTLSLGVRFEEVVMTVAITKVCIRIPSNVYDNHT